MFQQSFFIFTLIYGYLRILITTLIEKKKETNLVKAFAKEKSFRSIYTRAAGIATGFFFVGWNIYNAIAYNYMFHFILAEFYWFVCLIKLYMDYISDRDEGLKKDVSYTIINVILILISGVVVAITCFVMYFDAIFKKSWLTVFPIALFTIYKMIMAIYSFVKSLKNHSAYDWTSTQLSFSCALFSSYTLAIGLMILYVDNTFHKEYAYIGFIVSAIIFVLATIGLGFFSHRINSITKEQKQIESK